jgi:hypothetical protein
MLIFQIPFILKMAEGFILLTVNVGVIFRISNKIRLVFIINLLDLFLFTDKIQDYSIA